MSSRKAKISVIMPAYNVEDTLKEAVAKTLDTLASIVDDYEVIIVDDGSTDRTAEIASSLDKNPHLKVLRHARNMGKGAAIKTGVKHATGEYTILIDADMEINPEQIRGLITMLREYDVIVASKRCKGSIYKAPLMRKILSTAFNALTMLLLKVKIRDTQTGLKAFKSTWLKRIMNLILVKRYAYDAEVLAVANLLKLKIGEVPVHVVQSARFSPRAVMHMLIDLMGITYRLRLIKWYQKNLHRRKPEYKPIIQV